MKEIKNFIDRNKNYIKHRDVDSDIYNKYKNNLPKEILYIWEHFGFGTFEDGFIRFVNPDEYAGFLKYCDVYLEPTIVVAVTAMGDLLAWEGNDNPTIAEDEGNRYALFILRKGKDEMLGSTPFVIDRKTGDKEFIEDKEYFDSAIFYKAREQKGPLAYDECYGFTPLLAFGGKESVNNIRIVKTKEYLDIIGQAIEPIT